MGYGDDFILDSLPWARRFASACASSLPSYLDRDDLQSAGVLGYLRAATRYDVSKGASFRGFCAVRIRGAVLDELRRWDWAPRSVHNSQKRITRVTSELIEKLDREPTPQELAAAMDMTLDELAGLRRRAQTRQIVSLDDVGEYDGEDSLSLTERLPDPQASSPDSALLSAEERKLLLDCLCALPKVQARVIVLHYLQNEPLRSVAGSMGVTPSRVSQLHHQALGKLRQSFRRARTNS